MEVLRRPAEGRPALATAWWTILVLRGLLPAAFAVAIGALVSALDYGPNEVAEQINAAVGKLLESYPPPAPCSLRCRAVR